VAWYFLPQLPSMGIGAMLTATSAVLSIRGLARRLDSEHRLVRMVRAIPGGRLACGI
jgi:hypothetical protein